MKILAFAVVEIACLCFAATSHADSPGKKAAAQASASAGSSAVSGVDVGQAFQRADIDGDGKVSKAEAAGDRRLVTGFDRADRNHDGQLSRKEFNSIYRPQRRARR